MVFVVDDLAAWLIALLADAGRKKLTTLLLGDAQQRALQQAADPGLRPVCPSLACTSSRAGRAALAGPWTARGRRLGRDGDGGDVAGRWRDRLTGEPQAFDVECNGFTHLGFALFQSVSRRNDTGQVRRVGAVVSRHPRSRSRTGPRLPLSCRAVTLAAIFLQSSLPQNTVSCLGVELGAGLTRHRNEPGLARVSVLPMTSLLTIEIPPITGQKPQH